MLDRAVHDFNKRDTSGSFLPPNRAAANGVALGVPHDSGLYASEWSGGRIINLSAGLYAFGINDAG
jgi:hypothetical protein